MPPAPFYPPADASTYRDLLLFEERLKTNAAKLKRTKTRYQVFLAFLIFIISLLASEVLLDLDFMFVGPTGSFLRGFLPTFPYLEVVGLFVAVMTLVLFIATGTYTEKIAYANKYVLHANRSLRSFNMYLNVRAPPLLSTASASLQGTSPPSSPPPPTRKGPRNSNRPVQIAPIPPSSNPRGELIFSNRVSGVFRDGYERYRAAFERRREERERLASRSWIPLPWRSSSGSRAQTPSVDGKDGAGQMLGTPSPAPSRRNSPAPVPGEALGLSVPPGMATRGSVRKRGRGGGSRAGTPRGERERTISTASSSGGE
ncbi:hypothetical protein EXIGLDRAFT_738621 [Exidia glandulosa HHB12029]|uniref:Transmembrane protein 188 n=1 Tax=Exidia glandulosa HHB12029 TaxID=1314781 RepID=A0A165NN36_EXIGL|nr:hypothetical protein EXIGLDRAFT_738621 [Exidia glandulosa HHB12029]